MYIRKLTSQVILDYGRAEVHTQAGTLRGVISDGTCIFRGVRYAQAQRFHLPEPVTPWEGVKEAITYGNACPEIFTCVPHDQYTVPHYFTVQSEDCQFLNIWTQSIEKGVKKPVMVWFHGGGMMTGSGVEHYAYDGEELSRFGDVVVVTLNHRLNVLGFLDLSAYGEEYRYSGNAGLADLVAALQWIHENIAAFGGDPDNVMLFGQSGGGSKVVSMLQSPRAAGLFHRACLQSGGMRPGTEMTRSLSRRLASYILEYLKISPEHVKERESIHYDELACAADYAAGRLSREEGRPVMYGPFADQDFYSGHPLEHGFIEDTRDVPVLCGSVFGEFLNNYASPVGTGSKNSWTEEYKYELLCTEYGEGTEKIIEAFRKAYPDKNTADILFMDADMRRNALAFARQRAEFSQAGVYNFLFTLESPFNGGTVPWHNAEIPYVFHNAEYLEPSFIPGITPAVQDIVSGAWVNFAKTGSPNGSGIPQWDAFGGEENRTMVFDRECRLETDHDKELLELCPARKVDFSKLMGSKK